MVGWLAVTPARGLRQPSAVWTTSQAWQFQDATPAGSVNSADVMMLLTTAVAVAVAVAVVVVLLLDGKVGLAMPRLQQLLTTWVHVLGRSGSGLGPVWPCLCSCSSVCGWMWGCTSGLAESDSFLHPTWT